MVKNKPQLAESMGCFVGKKKALPLTPSILKIIVGEGDDAQEFQIHEVVLTARSKFFKAAMGRQWKESEEKMVKLPEDDPEVFALYSQLLYTGSIPGMNDEPDDSIAQALEPHCNTQEACEEKYKLLCRLYVLAEKMMDLKAKNDAVEALYFKNKRESAINNDPELRCLPSAEAIRIMYDGTPSHCPGRQILVSTYIYEADHCAFRGTTTGEHLPDQFLRDLVFGLMACRSLCGSNPMREQQVEWSLIEKEDEDKDWKYLY